jgi:ribonuclease T1
VLYIRATEHISDQQWRHSDAAPLNNLVGDAMMVYTSAVRSAVLLLFFSLSLLAHAHAASCEKIVSEINDQLRSRIDQQELTEMLRSLNHTNNRQLPPKFLKKREARSRGWQPGKDLWSVEGLRGSSLGGDQFRNLENRLPSNKWREADLDYKGGHRGGKRLVFSRDGKRFVTVDHYGTFVEIPSCR